MTFETLTVDRYPIPGIEGGKYARGNSRPACSYCNSADGAFIAVARRLAVPIGA